MAANTLLEMVIARFGIDIDGDSDGGQVLDSLLPAADLADGLRGSATVRDLTLALGPKGLSVHAAGASDALVLMPPKTPWAFEIKPPPTPGGALLVQIELVAPRFRVPFLRPALLTADQTLEEGPAGPVQLVFPSLLLVVSVGSGNPDATAEITPSHGAGGALELTVEPPYVLFGAGAVLGFHLPVAQLLLEPQIQIRFPQLEVFVAPPSMPALAMHGGATDLIIATDGAGLSGNFHIAAASGAMAPKRPRFLHNVAARLRLDRSVVNLLEVSGQVELSAEIGQWLGGDISAAGPTEVDYRLTLTVEATSWNTTLHLGASGGQDFLWRSRTGTAHEHDLKRDTLGAYTVFAPLLDPALPDTGSSGLVELALDAGLAGGIARSNWITTQSVTVYGAELAFASGPDQSLASLFFETETEVNLDVQVGGSPLLWTRRPIRVRQKAVGLKLDFGGGGGPPKLSPVFDPGQGFSLDLSDPGTFEIPGPLGEFLQPDAARVARDNPLVFEVDLVTKLDLGVVKIDKASLRVPLMGDMVPTLTGLGAHLDLGLISGGGYLRVRPQAISGGFDLSVGDPLGIRVQADLDIETGAAVSLLLNLEVEWPVPIPLLNSGFGLFGILGLLGVNRRRDMRESKTALDWLVRAGGKPRHGKWTSELDAWSFGVGAVIGTLEGGFLLHARGMLMIELPGPRILLLMKADMLSLRPGPQDEGDDMGTLTAVIEITGQSITLGIIADYSMPFLLDVQVPAEALFNFKDLSDWHFDLGSVIEERYVSIRFMSTIRADGYLMFHGKGIVKKPLLDLPGMAVAAGVRAALTWGPEEIGLYIRVTVEANIGISFNPMMLVGQFSLEGELHLFIVSIGASALAQVRISDDTFYVRAAISGSVDFFFFELSATVTLELGTKPPPPEAGSLFRALSLHARSHALLPGSGATSSIDGSLGTALAEGVEGALPVVPIDAIPVLQLEMPAIVAKDTTFSGVAINSLLPQGGHVQRGERLYSYVLTGVSLEATGHANPLQEGDVTVTWWDSRNLSDPGNDEAVQLALLSAVPTPTPSAALRSETHTEQIRRRWGEICAEIAPPTSVLWTFAGQPARTSPTGWTLQGQPMLDPPDTLRSEPPPTELRVTECWRSHGAADSLVDVLPARIVAATGLAGRLLLAPKTGATLQPRPQRADSGFERLVAQVEFIELEGLADGIRLDAGGLRHVRGLVVVPWESGRLVLRRRDTDGNRMDADDIDLAAHWRPIGKINDLPADWQNAQSGWQDLTQAALDAWFGSFAGPLMEAPLFLFDIEGLDGAATIEIGRVEVPDWQASRWGLLAVEVLTEAEFKRHSFDTQRRDETIAVIDGMLTGVDGARALLHPRADYRLSTTYTVAVADLDESGAFVWGAPQERHQTFLFRTDALPPQHLETLVMATSPMADEQAVFYRDPVTVVFSTAETRKLFQSYGRPLMVRTRAASGRHPVATDGFDPADMAISGLLTPPRALPYLALTPFEAALEEVLADQPCVNFSRRSARHEAVTVKLAFEKDTNYVFELDTEPPREDANEPMLRRNFSTSHYPDAEAFAHDIGAKAARHRYCGATAALAALPPVLSDLAFERMLREIGWGDLARPKKPLLTVIWTGPAGTPSQPVAALVETTEPHWRSRLVPQVTPNGLGTLSSLPWLELEQQAGGSIVTGLSRCADGSRTMVLLREQARGQELSLCLRRIRHPVFDADEPTTTHVIAPVLLSAPAWEATS